MDIEFLDKEIIGIYLEEEAVDYNIIEEMGLTNLLEILYFNLNYSNLTIYFFNFINYP